MIRIPLALLGLLVLAASARADESTVLEEVAKFQDEGTKWFNTAGNTDLSHSERNKARVKSYEALKQAYALLDAYVTEHPGRMEALEDRMVKIHMMIYWIRKESPIGLLSGEGSPVSKPKPPQPGPGPKPPQPGPGPKPPRPGPGPGPKPPTPEPAAPNPADLFRDAEKYERDHPADVAGALERYRSYMAQFPDPGSDLFNKALERSSILNSRLKDAYRKFRQEDPDTLDPKRTLSPEEKSLVLHRTRDLKSRNDEERRRAAMDLGLLGSSEGSYNLVRALKTERVAAVIDAIEQALVKIGGKKTTEVVAGLNRSRKTDVLLRAIRLLLAIGQRDAVQGKYAGLALAKFVHLADGQAGQASFDALRTLGRDGGVHGLCDALGNTRAPAQRRVVIIEALGDLKDPRAASVLGRFLLQKGNRLLRDKSIEALKKIGIDTVPYLIEYLKSPPTKQWTNYALWQITGQRLSSKPSAWAEWWKRYQAARELRGK